jgi:1-acyl-sn-glycerol-3-phosphate acyltransferase
VRGIERIPADGRALLVANHTRAPLWDGIILRTALRLHHATHRCPRWLVDDRQYHAPFLGTFVNRLGAVRACQENAERLLRGDELVAVFPEGANGANRRYEDRHRLQRFGRGGFVKLALRTATPVIPVAIVTCDHILPAWHSRLNSASRALRAPLTAFAAGRSPLGLLSVPPITSPVRITIGEPVGEIARHRQDARATEDDGLIHELNECVRGAVQELVNATLRS